MKWLLLALGLSLAGNLVLAWHRQQATPPAPLLASSSPAAAPPSAAPAALETTAQREATLQDLLQRIENGDTTAVAALRAAGWPEEWVRRLVLVQLRRQQQRHSQEVWGNPANPTEYWRPSFSSSRLKPETYRAMQLANRQALARAEAALGYSLAEELAAEDTSFPGLSASGRLRLLTVIEDSQARALEARQAAGGLGAMTPAGRAAQQAVAAQMAQEVLSVLSPAEAEVYRRQFSPAANALRNRMQDFDLTEAEFLALLPAFEQQQTSRAVVATDDDAIRQAQQAAQTQLNDALRATLGDARFAEYKESQNSETRTLRRLTTQFSLTPEQVAAVTAARQEVTQQLSQATSADSARELRRAAVQKAERELRRVLGDSAYETYRNASAWLGAPQP